MANDVIIRVRVRQDSRDGFEAVTKDAEAHGQKSAEKFTSRFGAVIGRMNQIIQEPLRRAGQKIGETIGDHGGSTFVSRFGSFVSSAASRFQDMGRNIGERIGRSASTRISEEISEGITRGADGRLRDSRGRFVSGARSGGVGGKGGEGGKGGDANVDVDKQSLLSRFLQWGKDGATSFWEGFSDKLSNFFSGDVINMIIKGIGFAALGLALAIPLSSAITSALLMALGGGVIAVGVAGAFKDPRILAAGNELKERLNKLFAKFGEPFRSPVANFLEKLNQFVTTMTPSFERLAKVLGPVADKLGSGIIGMLQNMMPGLISAMEDSAPVIETLANRLPDIGQALGDFFKLIGEHVEEASVFFNDLITVIIKVIEYLGKFIAANVELYSIMRTIFTNGKKLILDFSSTVIDWFERILDSAVIAFGWIPGLGGKLAGAKAAFADARKNINAELGKIKDKTVTIRMRTFGLAAANAAVGVASQLAAMGYAHGGISGMLPQIGRAASGGIRNGLTLVGERGPELIDAAPGSRISSNEDTRRMLSAGSGQGGGEWMEARWVGSGNAMVDGIMAGIQLRVVRQFSGNVQAAMGRGSA